MLITFEGIDRCGKSTQAKLLADALVQEGHTVELFREPGSTPLGEQIRSVIKSPDEPINPYAELALFLACRAQLIPRLNNFLNASDDNIAIVDRFDASTTAYQLAGHRLPGETVRSAMRSLCPDKPEPDVTFLIEIDVDEMVRRQRGTSLDSIETKDIPFFRRVHSAYDAMALSRDEFVCVDGTQSIGKIHTEILNFIRGRIAQGRLQEEARRMPQKPALRR